MLSYDIWKLKSITRVLKECRQSHLLSLYADDEIKYACYAHLPLKFDVIESGQLSKSQKSIVGGVCPANA